MTEDDAAPSTLVSALRALACELVAEVKVATRMAVATASAYALGAVVVLSATAVSTGIGVYALARGLHTLVRLMVGSAWVADLLIGIILVGCPLALLALLRRQGRAPARIPHPPSAAGPAR
jgi:hypothetical protein